MNFNYLRKVQNHQVAATEGLVQQMVQNIAKQQLMKLPIDHSLQKPRFAYLRFTKLHPL